MYILKFVLHSWWRNKLFVTISLVSLVIGIACTNLLTAFVLYEYNIEYNNPNRDRILRLTQTLPFAQQEMQGTFVYHESVPEIISQFPEIEASLRTQAITHTKIRVGDQEYSELNLLSADSTLPKFIPIETLAGKIEEVLTHPGTIASAKLWPNVILVPPTASASCWISLNPAKVPIVSPPSSACHRKACCRQTCSRI